MTLFFLFFSLRCGARARPRSVHMGVSLCPLAFCEQRFSCRALAGARRIGGCPPEVGVTDKVNNIGKSFYSCVFT